MICAVLYIMEMNGDTYFNTNKRICRVFTLVIRHFTVRQVMDSIAKCSVYETIQPRHVHDSSHFHVTIPSGMFCSDELPLSTDRGHSQAKVSWLPLKYKNNYLAFSVYLIIT